jgi:hypothetical protein
MTDLSPEARALVELARDGDSPDPADRARVRRALASSLTAAGVMTGAASAAASKGAIVSGAAAKSALGAWLALGVVAGLAGTAAIYMKSSAPAATMVAPGTVAVAKHVVAAETTKAPHAESALETPRVESTTPTVEAPGARVAAANPSLTTPLVASATAAPRHAARPSPAEHAVAAPSPAAGKGVAPSSAGEPAEAPAETAPRSTLGAETSLLEAAHAALSRGDASSALALLERHEHEFPTGALVEERLAAKVFALCQAGRKADATRAAARLLRLSPSTPFRARVLDSCAYEQ